jgi:uncharacterized membrane protein
MNAVGHARRNVGTIERVLSAVAGTALAARGLHRRTSRGWALAAVGAGLLERGVTGRCRVYGALGVNRDRHDEPGAATSVPYRQGIRVEHAITVARPAEELYRLWRNLENFPLFFEHVRSVTHTIEGSHWVVEGPLGSRVEWDAIVVNDLPGRLLAWRSVEGSDIDHAGSVHFDPLPGGRATEVRVEIEYRPRAGAVGALVAKLLGENPEREIASDLRRFKQAVETGALPRPAGARPRG